MKSFVMGLMRRTIRLARPIKTRTLEEFDFLPETAEGGMLELENCIIIPGATGIHDRQGRPIPESHVQRGPSEKPVFVTGMPTAIESPMEGQFDELATAIVLPKLKFMHFGLLLTETAGWLSAFVESDTQLLDLARKGTPIVIMGDTPYLEESAKGVMRVLQLTPESVLLSKHLARPLICRRILLPQPTMVDHRAMDVRHLHAAFEMMNRWYGLTPFKSVERPNVRPIDDGNPKQRLYLSRSKMPNRNRKLLGEEILEDELQARGWRILHPETLPIQEQIQALRHARVIAGTLGSAFHLLMYLGLEAKGKTVIGLGTERIETDRYSWIYNFVNQFRLQGIEFRHLSCLDFDASTSSEKAFNIIRYHDQRPIYGIRRIVRCIQKISDRATKEDVPSSLTNQIAGMKEQKD